MLLLYFSIISQPGLINDLLPHASLVIIDDLDLFAKINSFEAIDGQTGRVTGSHSADWRSITCDSVQMSCSTRAHGTWDLLQMIFLFVLVGVGGVETYHADDTNIIKVNHPIPSLFYAVKANDSPYHSLPFATDLAGCFKMKKQNRFIIMLRPAGGRSAETPADSPVDQPRSFCQDLVLRSMYGAAVGATPAGTLTCQDPQKTVESVLISVPGSALQAEGLEKVRSHGRWWKQIADAIEREYRNSLGHASNSFKDLQDRMQEERTKTAKLCQKSVEHVLTREQSIALHDDLIQAFLDKNFQTRLAASWAAAKGDKTKEQKCKRELCLPFQLPIMEKYGFERSEKGVFKCLWSIRTTFFNFATIEDVDKEMQLKAVFLDFLVNPGKDLHPDVIPFAEHIYPKGYAAVCQIRTSTLN